MNFVFLSENCSFCVKFSCLISEQTPLKFFIKKFSPFSRQSEIVLTPPSMFPSPPAPLYINNDRSLTCKIFEANVVAHRVNMVNLPAIYSYFCG